jgi:hypothetical protein
MSARLLFFAGPLVCALMMPSMLNAVAMKDGPYIVRPTTFIKDDDAFPIQFPTIEEAKFAALGNKVNTTLREGSEFLFLNNPCEDNFHYSLYMTGSRFNYISDGSASSSSSPHILVQITALDQPDKPFDVGAVYDANNPSPATIEDQFLGKLYAELLTYTYDPDIKCKPLPLGIIFQNGRYKSFDRNDAGTPLVGKRFHDATVIEATRVTLEQAKSRGDEKLAVKGVPNTFNNLQDSLNAAKRLAGDKIIMFDGQVARIYRADENADIPGIGRMYKNVGEYVEALKKAKPDNGMTILALVIGDKGAIPISAPTK